MLKKNQTKKFVSIDSDFSSFGKYSVLIPKILEILNQLNFDIDYKFILSVVKQESGTKFTYLKQIRGDSGTAFGLMQVRQGALTDVNNRFNTDYDLIDLDNIDIGLFVGIAYLKIIYEKMQGRNEPITYEKLAYYYNSGYGQKKSNEAIKNASLYSDSVTNNYNYFSTLG